MDGIYHEQIKKIGPAGAIWLTNLCNNVVKTTRVPKLWLKSKVVAILKPGKDPNDRKSYRPISLLCHLYKLFERLLLNRVQDTTDKKLIPQQVGFHQGKNCSSQVTNLIQHIENGFEQKKITGAVFVDLTAAYDTVNHNLLCKKIHI